MATHRLKTWPEYFDAMASGAKTFEVRWDDRGIAVDDTLACQKFDPATGDYVRTNVGTKPEMIRTLWRRVTYVLRGGQFGVEPGYVVLGLTEETRHISAEDLKRLTV